MPKEDKWKQITIGAIQYVQSKRDSYKIAPNYAPIGDILNLTNEAIKTTLKKLVESGEIKEIDTMRGKCYEIIKKQDK